MIGIVQDKRSFPNPEEFLKLGYELGAQHVEFKYEARLDQAYNIRGEMAGRLREFAQEKGITLSIHAPYDQGISFGDPNPEVQAITRQRMLECLEFAEKISATYITVHGGSVEVKPEEEVKAGLGTPNRVTMRDKVSSTVFAALKERTFNDLAWFIREGRARGIVIAIENYHDFSFSRLRYPIIPSDFTECRQVLGDCFSINFDSGHAHSTGIHILDFISGVGPENIVGTHLHDNNQLTDEHLAIFAGTIDFAAFFRIYKESQWQFALNIEIKDRDRFFTCWDILKSQMSK